jgi:dihydroorotate dehydrogenase electron transfer subunit
MVQTQALILNTNILAPGYYLFTILAPEIAIAAKPGQFIQIGVNDPGANDPILPRPISLFSRNEAEGSISFIFKVVGRGTGILAGKKKGELLTVRGPIGNGFSVAGTARNILLIAGGIGMPPLYFLAEHLQQTTLRKELLLFYGGRTRRDLLVLERWSGLGIKLFPATDDGSFGYHGIVTDYLFEEYQQMQTPPDFLAACGPGPMLKAVQDIAGALKIPGELSLEAHMACGVGACLGCVCETIQGYRRVCVDGPVFPVDEVLL